MLQYWNQTLENIRKDPRNGQFKLIFNKKIYNVPISFALGISPYISFQYLNDPTFNEFEIKFDTDLNDEMIQKAFSNFLNGEKIGINLFYELGKQFKNKEMINIWKRNALDQLDQSKIDKRCLFKKIFLSRNDINDPTEQNMDDIKPELDYISKHLEEMKEEIKKLTDQEFIYLIRNENINIKNEDLLWDIIKERVDSHFNKKKEIQRILLGSIYPNNLNYKNFKEYLEMIQHENLIHEENIWNNLKKILLFNLQNFHIKVINHEENKDFDGIIKSLQNQYGPNLCQQGIIEITSTPSEYKTPEKVIDYSFNSWWISRNLKNSWLPINFKKRKVKLNGYSLKSLNNGNCLKKWIIEGSNDNYTWVTIDEKKDNNDLDGRKAQKYFSISNSTDPFQYIRMINTGKNHGRTNFFVLTNIEFFGEIIEEKEIN